MKLPEYDNRPGPGTPLYSDPRSDWSGIKIAAWALGVVVLFIASVGAIVYGLFN
jgi:hypothetical protein